MSLIEGVTFQAGFVAHSQALFYDLLDHIRWDTRMAARKTASFGRAYNYSQMQYPYQEMLPQLVRICDALEGQLGFRPNNCLINLYPDGRSKMGYHSDQTDILEDNTGVAIVSLGEARVLRFRRIEDKLKIVDYELPAGSLLYMDQAVQQEWQHAIPKSADSGPRMSLTFRQLHTDTWKLL